MSLTCCRQSSCDGGGGCMFRVSAWRTQLIRDYTIKFMLIEPGVTGAACCS